MKKEDFSELSDSEIVAYFRDAAIRRAQCGFNVTRANRICEREMGPAYEAMAARGQAALRELLLLTDDPSPNVREDAAIFAYDANPVLCREVLEKLLANRAGWEL